MNIYIEWDNAIEDVHAFYKFHRTPPSRSAKYLGKHGIMQDYEEGKQCQIVKLHW